MVVRTQSNGRGVSGLLLRKADVRRHIPRDTAAIELQLGELRIHCQLPPEFWRGRPEICDRRLRDWLEFKIFHSRTCRLPMALEMTPTGRNSFKLQIPACQDGAKHILPPEEFAAATAFASTTSNPVLESDQTESAVAPHLS